MRNKNRYSNDYFFVKLIVDAEPHFTITLKQCRSSVELPLYNNGISTELLHCVSGVAILLRHKSSCTVTPE